MNTKLTNTAQSSPVERILKAIVLLSSIISSLGAISPQIVQAAQVHAPFASSAAFPFTAAQDFIRQVAPWAQAEQRDSGVPASFSIAQAAWESAWGSSSLASSYNNYHGIRCSSPSEGLSCVQLRASDGTMAWWNRYSSAANGFLWHGRWLRGNSNYRNAFNYTNDPFAFAREVLRCYTGCQAAFPQNYYNFIVSTINNYNLRQYDGGCVPNAEQVALFMDINFGGQCVVKGKGDYANPSAIGLPNDSVSSLRIGTSVQAVLCRDDNYGGGCENFTGDDSDLRNNSIGNDQVSSVRVQSRRSGGSGMGVTYQAHVEGIGWVGWVTNGDVAGTTGQSRRMEAVRIQLVNAPPGVHVTYQVHVESIGWMDWVWDGAEAGTTGRSLRMEAVRIRLDNAPPGYGMTYQAHVEGIGWMNWVSNGEIAGTTGQSRRMEAIRIRITGP